MAPRIAGTDQINTFPTKYNDLAIEVENLAVVTINNQPGDTYTLVLSDAGKVIERNSATSNAVVIPTNAAVAFPVGTSIELFQMGAGPLVVSGTDVTILTPLTLRAATRYSTLSLRKRALDEWVLSGDLAAT